MNHYSKYVLIITCIFISLSHNLIGINSESANHHVVCSLKHLPKNKSEHQKCNHAIHQATYEIKQQCKRLYKNPIDHNDNYEHHRDSVFFIHFNHEFNNWTLYKPSFIPYPEFVKLIKKIYAQYGLQVVCSHDQIITIAKKDMGFENSYLTIDEFENYKKMSENDFSTKVADLKNNTSFLNNNSSEIERLQNIQEMKKFFFWHWQIPTTGLLEGGRFDIENQYKPLAWHYLLWDLAQKKGQGACVAIIDTGISAFNLKEKEFSDIYKKNINITMPDVLQDYGYNLVSENGLDPIRQVAINFGHYCDHIKFDSDDFMQKLPLWIIDFIKNKNELQLEQFFTKNAKNEYIDKESSSLNEKGRAVLKDLLYGKYGIAPSEKKSFFNIVELDDPYNKEVLLETLPAPKIIGNEDPFSAGHGTFTQGIVNAQLFNDRGIHGLAPHAQVTMIKAFNDNGTTNKTTLNAALQRAITLRNPIVSMSLKITDTIDKISDAPLKELIDSIDYVVAASGNDGNTKLLHNKEAYPAKFDSVAFDVGAFQYDDGEYNVCSFTQMEPNIGPKFVAPGFDIFSSGLTPHQTSDSMYLFMAGTSIAVPVVTGFLALVLAEFQDVFTREQILKVIYKFSIKLNDDAIWQKYIKLGTPDMRSTLLCLHVLKYLQQTLEDDLKYSLNKNFDNLVEAIYTINYFVPKCYEEIIGASLTRNFADFSHALELKHPRIETLSFFNPLQEDLSSCVQFISQLILNAINSKKYNDKKSFNFNKQASSFDDQEKNQVTTNWYNKLSESLKTIINTKNFKLFAQLSPSSQTRIKAALSPRASCIAPKI